MDDVRLLQNKIAAARQAWRIMRDPKTVFLDSETTGLDGARFVELGVIDAQGNTLINQRIDPMADITAKAAEIHGIQPWMLVGQPRFFEIFQDVAAVLAGKRLVIYNVRFDGDVFLDEIKRMGGLDTRYQHLQGMLHLRGMHCAMFLYAQFHGQFHEYWGNFTWQKLVKASDVFDVQVALPPHSAVGDCLRTLGVMRGMARWYEEFSSQYKELVS